MNKEVFERVRDFVEAKYGFSDSLSFSVCDEMISHLVAGELDEFLFGTHENYKEVAAIAHKYQDLCFYDGDSDNWADSVEGPFRMSDELMTMRIFDNFSFLMSISNILGEDTLKELRKLKDMEGYQDSSVIDYLRSTFGNDNLLINSLMTMYGKDSTFSIFTDNQKGCLLTYPEGTLYYYGDGGYKFTNPILLSLEIYSRMHSNSENVTDDVSSMVAEMESFFQKDVDFSQVVSDMSLNYHESIRKITGGKPKDVLELFRDMSGSIPNASWNIDSNPLVQMLETPYHPDPSNQSTKNR